MKNKEWYDNISDKGVLCMVDNDPKWIILALSYNKTTKSILTADKCGGFVLDSVKPITPQEWWSFAPWNYDMDSADKSDSNIILKDEQGYVDTALWSIDTWWSNTTGSRFHNPIAWLPLSENK